MTDLCARVRAVVIESFDEPAGGSADADIAGHLRSCQACAALLQRHRDLDVRLAMLFTPPSVGPACRRAVWRDVRRDKVEGKVEQWSEWLPIIMSFAGCAIVLAGYLTVAPTAIGSGAVYGLVSVLGLWAALSAVGSWLEDDYS